MVPGTEIVRHLVNGLVRQLVDGPVTRCAVIHPVQNPVLHRVRPEGLPGEITQSMHGDVWHLVQGPVILVTGLATGLITRLRA